MTFVQNNFALILVALISGGMLLWPLLSRRADGEVGTLAAVQLINHQDALVLDVREDIEYDAGHIADAKHIPVGKMEGRLQELEKFKNKPIVVVCRSGMRSSRACSVLRKHGFTDVHNLAGGINAWQQASLPVAKK